MATKEKAKRNVQRKRKPKILAVINDACTGYEVENPDAPVFNRVHVDPLLCIGCKKCITKGPMDTLLEGCPWDAIDMMPVDAYEAKFGTLPY